MGNGNACNSKGRIPVCRPIWAFLRAFGFWSAFAYMDVCKSNKAEFVRVKLVLSSRDETETTAANGKIEYERKKRTVIFTLKSQEDDDRAQILDGPSLLKLRRRFVRNSGFPDSRRERAPAVGARLGESGLIFGKHVGDAHFLRCFGGSLRDGKKDDAIREALFVASMVCGLTGVVLVVASAFLLIFRLRKRKSETTSLSEANVAQK
nr:Transmembrane protein [Ipomoea batatas]